MRKSFSVYLVMATFIFLSFPYLAFGSPSITEVTGDFSHNKQLTIKGSSFGNKNPAKPYLWAPFDGSLSPSELGIVTSWSGVDHMGYSSNEGVAGSGCLKATDNSGVWTANVNGFAWNALNQKMYLFRKIKKNFAVDDDLNWKVWRLWAINFSLPNTYIQIGNGCFYTEGGVMPRCAYLTDKTSARGVINEWKTDEIIIKSNSALDQADATFEFWVNGALAGHAPYSDYMTHTFKMRDADHDTDMTMNFVVHGVKANTTFPDDYRYWADDVYLDTTWARVMIGNASTLASSTHREIQIPSAWTDGSITITINQGTFAQGTNAYLFVIDADGNASPGYPITIGGSGSKTIRAPAGLRVIK